MMVRDCRAFAVMFAFVCACAIGAFPRPAYAWLNEVTDSYPASQEIPISGETWTGADVPEGNYSVTIGTSSYMCKMTDATLTSVGGELWITFTMSKAYNALYLGTAEEAASLSSEEGDDYSPYITVDPIEGYVARVYSLPIPALNYEITLATFSGGNNGTKKGLWYTRAFVVNSSDEIEEAIAGGGGEEDPPDGGEEPSGGDEPADDPSDEPADDGSDDGSDNNGDTGDDEPSSEGDDSDGSEETDDSDDGKSSGNSNKTSTSTGNDAQSAANAANDSPENEAAQKESASSSKASAKKAKKGVKVGKLISVADPNQVVVEQSLPDIEAQQAEEQEKQSNMTAMAAGMAVANAALIGAFVVGLRNARPRKRSLDLGKSEIEG